jgi:hypothetical protein
VKRFSLLSILYHGSYLFYGPSRTGKTFYRVLTRLMRRLPFFETIFYVQSNYSRIRIYSSLICEVLTFSSIVTSLLSGPMHIPNFAIALTSSV